MPARRHSLAIRVVVLAAFLGGSACGSGTTTGVHDASASAPPDSAADTPVPTADASVSRRDAAASCWYLDDRTGVEAERPTPLLFAAHGPAQVPPVASARVGSGEAPVRAGVSVLMDATASEPGSFAFDDLLFHWYLVAKPPGSRARLDSLTGTITGFFPDLPGTYEIEIFAVAFDPAAEPSIVSSAPATVSLDVRP